jgi:hypothetical protein
VNSAYPQSWNRYAYVQNNPLSLIDRLGLWCVWQDGTHDPDPPEDPQNDGSTDPAQACLNAGGLWDPTDTLTGCDGNWNCTTSNGSTVQGCFADQESCIWSPSDSITATADPLADPGSPSPIWAAISTFFSPPGTGPGSCLRLAASGFTSAAKAVQSTAKNVQKYVPPLLQSLPGSAATVSAGLYNMANYAQQMKAPAEDVAIFTAAAGAVSVAATNISALGRSALAAARNPYVLGVAADTALLYGVIKEGQAAYGGKCRP